MIKSRPFLEEISEFNRNIVSVKVSQIYCSTAAEQAKYEVGNSYLDFGVENFSFYVDENSIILINYRSILDYFADKKRQSIRVSTIADILSLFFLANGPQ